MKEKLTAEQIASLIKNANGNAIMASEDAINSGVGIDYRKEMIKSLARAKEQSPDLIKEAGKSIYGAADNSGLKLIKSPVNSAITTALMKRLPAAALGGVGLIASAGVKAASTDSAGQSPEDEKTMLAEIQARKNYDNSPAGKDAQAGRDSENQGLRRKALESLIKSR